jgi:peptidoglycan/xylan/chitin deacetylase (PgdA/CDA1 family)
MARTRPTVFLLAVVVGVVSSTSPARGLGEDSNGTLGILSGHDPRVFYSARTEERVIALTIDDAPDPDTTPALLQLLAENETKATFFVIANQIPGNELLLLDLVAAGHEVGNHMAHDRRSVRLSPETFERQLLNTRRMLEPFGGERWFRPGAGYYDDAMLDLLERHGYRCALGSVYPVDPQIPWSRFASRWILWRSKPGAVIILHDRGKRGKRTLKTLGRVLPKLREEGYRFVTLSELESLDGRRATAVDAPPDLRAGEAP